MTPLLRSRLCLCTAAFLMSSGCSDDGGDVESSATPTYAIGLRVLGTGQTQTGFVAFTDDLTSGQLELSDALEFPGGGRLWGVPGTGTFFVTRNEEVTLAKYAFQNGGLQQLDRLSLARQGITEFVDSFLIFDGPDRGYLFDLGVTQAIEIDLDAMEIVGVLDLSLLADPSLPTFISFGKFLPHETGLVAATYGLDLVEGTVSGESKIAFFDPSTGEVEALPAPCGGLFTGARIEGGDLIFAADPFVAAAHFLDDTRAPAPCLVRVSGTRREIVGDPIELNALTGLPTGGIIPAGESVLLLRALIPELLPDGPITSFEIFGIPVWNTWSMDVSAPVDATETEQALLPGGIVFFDVDGVVYENVSTSDFGRTILTRTNGPGAPEPALETPGLPFNIVRLR